ncbi:MAG: ribose-phosphate diphosphokinase [Erythrobacter sp.]|uniref:ribose-phosphate diphosphokinase n=1 Tax=Erythrobacter sp. TaxID=1042 RepID=UPI002606212C|nr:ribose-phosphate diphosphokinase [Erythrobacter sp.]MDJ0977546.1 ribose-phosphate diphosphokinase [Erythrobacter sp.]
MKPLLFPLHAVDDLSDNVCARGDMDRGILEHRRFPDGESCVRLETAVDNRAVVFLCSLDRPDERTVPLLLAADAARQQGAHQVGLIAPYLAYMRQDRAFRPGEAVSAYSFAKILSRHFDWLVTLEPHLHRIARLGDVYSIPARAAVASGPIGDWIKAHVQNPFLVGPDSESAPWIERVANHVGAPCAVLEKRRFGDRDVQITGLLEGLTPDMTPVVIDDIVSSGGTMAEIIKLISQQAGAPAIYIAVHALAEKLPDKVVKSSGFAGLISCNSVAHPSNRIDISAPLVAEAHDLIAQTSARHRL